MTKHGPDITPITKVEVLAESGGPVDEVRVTLGVYGADLDPDEISALLNCAPTSAHRRGDRRPNVPPWPQGAWLLSVEGKAPMGPNELIELLTGRLRSDGAIWEQLTTRYTVRLTLAVFTSMSNSGFELSPTSISRLAAIGGRVGFDIYVDPQGDEE